VNLVQRSVPDTLTAGLWFFSKYRHIVNSVWMGLTVQTDELLLLAKYFKTDLSTFWPK